MLVNVCQHASRRQQSKYMYMYISVHVTHTMGLRGVLACTTNAVKYTALVVENQYTPESHGTSTV